jgi:DNA-binding winged helix-turn-helix (wHTH) protein
MRPRSAAHQAKKQAKCRKLQGMATRFGEVLFDRESRRLTRSGNAVLLSPKAFDLLALLIDARPNVVPKDKIIDHLWPDVVVEEANVRNLVAEVRGAIGDDDRAPRFIRTVHRIGYAFVATAFEQTVGPAGRLIEAERTHFLFNGVNVLGRDIDCSVMLDATGVSRHHARITIDGNRVVLEDTASKNGTWVNSRRIAEPVELHDGDTIGIGVAQLRFRSTNAGDSTSSIEM